MNITNDKKMLDEMYDSFLRCPEAVKEIKRLKIDDEMIKKNIVKINDFVEDVNYCKNCPGVKNCKKYNPLLVTKIVVRKGIVDRQLLPCKRVLEQMEYEKQFYFRDFDASKASANLREVDKSVARNEVFLRVRDYLSGNITNWLFLTGAANTGRSFLASAIANEAARKKKGPISFINASSRFKEINDYSYNNKEEFEQMIAALSTCSLLIVDDFGNEFKNDFIRDGILFQILSVRSNRRLMTIFTSDFTIDEIITLYSTSKAGAIRARQIGNILKENCKKEINLGKISIY